MENPWRWLCVHLYWIFWPDNFYYRIKDVWDGFGAGHPPTNTRFAALRYSNGTTGFTRLPRILPRHKTGNKVVCNNIIAYRLATFAFCWVFCRHLSLRSTRGCLRNNAKRLRPIRPEWDQWPGLHCRDPVRAIRGHVARLIVDLDETEGRSRQLAPHVGRQLSRPVPPLYSRLVHWFPHGRRGVIRHVPW